MHCIKNGITGLDNNRSITVKIAENRKRETPNEICSLNLLFLKLRLKK